MEILIDIPGKTYIDDIINEMDSFLSDYFNGTVCKITPLPEGHGKLIDADKLSEEIFVIDAYSEESVKEQINDAPTVIPADKEI